MSSEKRPDHQDDSPRKTANPIPSGLANTLDNSSINQVSRHFNVIANTLTFTDGRDKSMKIIQYTLSLLMMGFLKKHGVLTELHKPIQGIVAMCSDARKVVRLTNFTGYFSKLVYLLQGRGYHPHQTLTITDSRHYSLLILKTAAEFLNSITDDLFCLGKFNVISKETGARAKEWSYKLWWTSLTVDLYLGVLKLLYNKSKIDKLKTNISEKPSSSKEVKPNTASAKDLTAQHTTLQVNIIKTVADLIFCGYDLFRIEKNKELMQLAAIVSGVIGYQRLWDKTNNITKA